jgi:hypothetical protein
MIFKIKLNKNDFISSPCQRQCELLPSLPSGFRGEDLKKIGQSETRIACGGHVC